MAETIDEITVINRALARIGAAPLTDLEADDDQTRQVLAIHQDLVEAIFGLWDWRWALRTHALDRLAETPVFFTGAFRFPATAVSGPKALYDDAARRATPLRDFAVQGRTVYADREQLWGDFVTRVAPSDWPAVFRLAYTTWLAAELCVPLTHDEKLKAVLQADAIGTPSEGGRGGIVGRAIAIDAAEAGAKAAISTDDTLTAAHMGDFSFLG